MAPDCPAPAFIKNEPNPQEHVELPDGRTYHFACHARIVRAAMADPPAVRPAEGPGR